MQIRAHPTNKVGDGGGLPVGAVLSIRHTPKGMHEEEHDAALKRRVAQDSEGSSRRVLQPA